ncbi:MAG TPA: beta-N-acetylhexosaminidase [Polyangiaceae bacterium]
MPSSLAQRAARLLCVGFTGRRVSPELSQLIAAGVSGVILFSRNVGSPEELWDLTRALKSSRQQPLAIAVDQEGGSVRRLRAGFTDIPALACLGATDDPSLARELGGLLGRELSAVGIDWNFAPVLDVDTNPLNPVIGPRSLGRNAHRVAALGVALATAMQEQGVAACGKHFPGHGDTELDSHLALPCLNHALGRLEQVEFVPFAAAAKAGIASIMTAHVLFSALDAEHPATMSAPIVRGLLRERLGFDGLVVSDDLEMSAIVDHYGIEEAIVLGIRAGVDLFLVCHTVERMHAAIEGVVHAVERGALTEAELENAERRIGRFLQQWAAPPQKSCDLSRLRSPAHLALAERLSGATSGPAGSDPTSYHPDV